MNAIVAIVGATVAISTDLQTMAGSLPPLFVVSLGHKSSRLTHSSNVTLFKVLLALSMILFPVAVDPVNVILSTPA